jgi:hypothetical protein
MTLEKDGTLIGGTDDKLMTDDEFAKEVELASEGRWEELGLDPPIAGFVPATIDDLRNAG